MFSSTRVCGLRLSCGDPAGARGDENLGLKISVFLVISGWQVFFKYNAETLAVATFTMSLLATNIDGDIALKHHILRHKDSWVTENNKVQDATHQVRRE